ncbi:MAG TPA: alpha/beta hydrolase [Rubricoccaceae bacterium]|jgi:pimeloyl-ACP methyl ester carboxylesterase
MKRSTAVLGTGALAGLTGAGLALFTARIARRVDRALPPQGQFLDVGGARLHYIDEGSGPPVVLINGLGGHARNFTHSLVARLSGAFRVVVVERPGSGHSMRPRGASAALGAQADTVAEFIRKLGLERPLVVGHSLGGAVALTLAVRHPDLVGGLALVSPLTHVQETVPDVFRLMAIRSPRLRRLAAWTVATPGALLRREAVLGTLFGPEPVPTDYATAGGGPLGLRPAAFYGASTDLMSVNDGLAEIIDQYGSIGVPVGVLYGTGDQVLDHAVHGIAVAEKIPDLQLELVEGGHMLPLTAPAQVAAFITSVAQRMSAASAPSAELRSG